jgi:hypothetical protein
MERGLYHQTTLLEKDEDEVEEEEEEKVEGK